MRHGDKINNLSRTASHRKAMMKNMACSLIQHKSIKTTVAKAKALRKFVEPLVTKSKTDTQHNRRVVFSYLQNKEAIKERRKAREQEQKQKRLVQVGAVIFGLLVIGIMGFFVLNSGNSGPDVAIERLELDPILGNPDAPVTVVEYSAFGCEACKNWHEAGVIEQILAQYPNQVKFIYRDLPIIDPAWSQAMSEIAQCAFDQGNDNFWLAHDIST